MFGVVLSTSVGGEADRDQPAEIETHCVVFVIGEEPDGEMITTDPVCLPRFEDALAFASPVVLASSEVQSGHKLITEAVEAEALLAAFTLGIHFDGVNGTGSSISVVGGACTGGYWNTPGAWVNRISSSWNGCHRLRHFDGPNKTGASADTLGAGATHNIPALLNNKAESVSYSSS